MSSDEAECAPGACKCSGGCSSCRNTTVYVYAMGRIRTRPASLAIEKELAQVAARSQTTGLTEAQMVSAILREPANRYLVRGMEWVFNIGGIDAYLLVPRVADDIALLVGALRDAPKATDVDLIVGTCRSPDSSSLPVVVVDQVYSFASEQLLDGLPPPASGDHKGFRHAAEELLQRVLHATENRGSTDEHRAINYLVVRYPAIYSAIAEAHLRNESLSAIDVRTSDLSGSRRIVDVVFSFRNRSTDMSMRSSVRVDVTERFPFVATRLSPVLS